MAWIIVAVKRSNKHEADIFGPYDSLTEAKERKEAIKACAPEYMEVNLHLPS